MASPDWNWTYVKSITHTNTNGQATWTINRADIGETNSPNAANIVFAAKKGTDPTALSAKYVHNYTGSTSIDSYSASNTADTLTYTFNYTGSFTWYQVMIDTDQNATTGYTGIAGLGADYMLADGALYQRTPNIPASNDWAWIPVNQPVTYTNANGKASWTIKREAIGENSDPNATNLVFAARKNTDPTVLSAKYVHNYNWQTRGMGGMGALPYSVFSRTNPNEIYAATDMSAVFHTTDFGQNWTTLPYTSLAGTWDGDIQFTSDPNILYAIHWSSAWWGDHVAVKSTDGGKTFNPLPQSPKQNTGEVLARLITDPGSTGRFIVASNEKVYFSSDAGQSYRVVDTDNSVTPHLRLAGAFWNGTEIVVATSQGLFISTNNGGSFTPLSVSGLPSGNGILNFAGVKNGTSRNFFITTRAKADILPSMDSCRIMEDIHSNTGIKIAAYTINWTNKQWIPLSMPTGASPCAIKISSNNIVYMAGSERQPIQPWQTDPSWYPGVWKSTNNGSTWQSIFKTVDNLNIQTGWVGMGRPIEWAADGLVRGFDISPFDPNRLVLTSNFVYTSQDAGTTWQAKFVKQGDLNPVNTTANTTKTYQTTGIDPNGVHWLHWSDSQTMTAAFGDMAAIHSEDGGVKWINGHDIGLPYNSLYHIIQHPVTGKLYAATSDQHDIYLGPGTQDDILENGQPHPGAIYVSDNKGASWQKLHEFDAPVLWLAFDPNNSERLYASVVDNLNGGIYRTDNLSAGTNASFVELPAPPRTEKRPFNIHVLNDGTLVTTWSVRQQSNGDFTDTSGVFVSSDNGQTWTDRSHANMHYWTMDLVVDPHDNTQNTWYVAVNSHQTWSSPLSSTGGLYRTTDRGLTWTRILGANKPLRVVSIALPPDNPNLAYVTTIGDGLMVTNNLRAATPLFTNDTTYPFRSPLRAFFNPYNTSEIWVASMGDGLSMISR